MSLNNEIPDICISRECDDLSEDDLSENGSKNGKLLNSKEVQGFLTDVEELSDSGQENDDNDCDNVSNGMQEMSLALCQTNNDGDDKCYTDVECYMNSDDEASGGGDASDYYTDTDILLDNDFDHVISEEILKNSVKGSGKNDDDDDEIDVQEELKMKKAQFCARKREKRAKRDAAKLFQRPDFNADKVVSSAISDDQTLDLDISRKHESMSSDTDQQPQPIKEKEKNTILGNIKKALTEPKKSQESLENIKESASHFIEKIVTECEHHLLKDKKDVKPDRETNETRNAQESLEAVKRLDMSVLDSAMDEVFEIMSKKNQNNLSESSLTKLDQANSTIDNFNFRLNEIEHELAEKRSQRKKDEAILNEMTDSVERARTNLENVNMRLDQYFDKFAPKHNVKFASVENIRDEVNNDVHKSLIQKKNSEQFEKLPNANTKNDQSSAKISEKNIDLSTIVVKERDSIPREKKCLFQLESEEEGSFEEIKPAENEEIIDLSTNDEGLMSKFFREQEDILRQKLSLLQDKFGKLASENHSSNTSHDDASATSSGGGTTDSRVSLIYPETTRKHTNTTNTLTNIDSTKELDHHREEVHPDYSKTTTHNVSPTKPLPKPRSASIITNNLHETNKKSPYERSASLPFNQYDHNESMENSPRNFTSTNLFKYKIVERDSIPSDSMEVNYDKSETEGSIDDIHFDMKYGTEKVDETIWEVSQKSVSDNDHNSVRTRLIKTAANEILKEIEDRVSTEPSLLKLIRKYSDEVSDEISDENLRSIEDEFEKDDCFDLEQKSREITRAFSEDYTANANRVFNKIIKFADSRRSLSMESDISDKLNQQPKELLSSEGHANKSRPPSSDVEALLTATTMTSEYETALSLQEQTSKSADYRTAVSSVESKDSISSESSGNLGSMEVSELSETLKASSKDDDDDGDYDDDGDCDDDDDLIDNENLPLDEPEQHLTKMKRSVEMTFQPEPKLIMESNDKVTCRQHKRQESLSESAIKNVMEDSTSIDNSKKFNESAVFNLPLTATSSTISKSLIEPIVEDEAEVHAATTAEKTPTFVAPSKEFTDVLMPHIKITQHMAPIVDRKFYYPEVELEKLNSEDERPKSPADSHDSFEIVDEPDSMEEFVVVEEVAREASENDMEGRGIKTTKVLKKAKIFDDDDDDDDDDDAILVQSAPGKLTNINADETEFQIDLDKPMVEEPDDWVDRPFTYEMDFERAPLEDIKEEEYDSSRIGSFASHKGSLIGSTKGSSSSSDYDVLAGKKFFSKFFEIDNQSLSSLQEFEQMEKVISLENRRKLLQHAMSQDSPNNGNGIFSKMVALGKHLQGDTISLSSLKEFEHLETSCVEAVAIEKRAKEKEESLLKTLTKNNSLMESSVDSLEPMKREDIYASRDSLDKINSTAPVTSSTDSLELPTRIRVSETVDSLELQPTCHDSLELSNDSMDEEGVLSPSPIESGSYNKDNEISDLTTSTNATYQLENADSIMSSSFTSGYSMTMAQSIELPSGHTSLSPLHFDSSSNESTTKTTTTVEHVIADDNDQVSTPTVREVIEPCHDDPDFSHTIHRYVEMPPEIKKISFTGPNAEREFKQFLEEFQEGEHVREEETIDADGNRHVTRVIQNRVLVRSESGEQSHDRSVSFEQTESVREEKIKLKKQSSDLAHKKS